MKHYIYCHEPLWNRNGGMVGYLSHLHRGYEDLAAEETDQTVDVHFLFPNQLVGNQTDSRAFAFPEYQDILKYRQADRTAYVERKLNQFAEVIPDEQALKIDLNEITSIHIHGAYNFIPVYNFLKFHGIEDKVVKILTTHNPMKPSLEDLAYEEARISPEDVDDLLHIQNFRDEFAYSHADVVYFPCKEAMEPYFETWPKFPEIIKDKPQYFSLTGALKRDVVTPRDVLRAHHGIPKDANVFLYIGRFMKVRGIDVFAEAARLMARSGSDSYFVAVGDNPPQQLVDSSNWLQLGFTDYPADYMAMSDCCVIASNHNYFDLGMIEILSQKVPLIASETGGSRYLKEKTEGVTYFKPGDANSLVEALASFEGKSISERAQMALENERLYTERLTTQHFAQDYRATISRLYRDLNIKEANRDVKNFAFERATPDVLPFPVERHQSNGRLSFIPRIKRSIKKRVKKLRKKLSL